MSNPNIVPDLLMEDQNRFDQNLGQQITEQDFPSSQTLPILITKAASNQTYYTIRFLVDRDLTLDAYRAYAYFRWVDDSLDQRISDRSERIDFLERQLDLMNLCYLGEWQSHLSAEETMVEDLIRTDNHQDSGLQSYIRNMMAVMAFDADRRGKLISQWDLTEYSRNLSTAVTEALHYFIGHDDPSPRTPARYQAVTGAHITHMLRDTFEDVSAGYFNIPIEFLDSHNLDPCDVMSDAYQVWVKERATLARYCFAEGKGYLAQVKNMRCQIAGYAYTARFEDVLNAIETENYQIRSQYLERKFLRGGLRIAGSIFSMLLTNLIRGNI